MKTFQLQLIIIFILLSIALIAQNDLVVFSNGGERFYLYVNGIKQNANPETNVRVTGIKQPWVKARVVFEDNKRTPDLNANVQFVWGAEEKQNWEFVYQIVNKTGKYKIKPYSAAPINNEKPDGQTIVNYTTTDAQPNVAPASSVNTSPSVSQTITTTTVVTNNVPTNNNSQSANIHINISPNSAGIQIHDNSPSNTNVSSTTSVVSTTVISSSSTNASSGNISTPVSSQPVAIKCAVSNTEFESIKKNISSKSFEDSKLTIAKQISDSKCLTSVQVRDIMKLFSFEETRLTFAKYAYKRVVDKENYYVVNDAFQFENSIEELNESIGK